MRKLIEFVLDGCWHDYEILSKEVVYEKTWLDNLDPPVKAIMAEYQPQVFEERKVKYIKYTLQCKKCGHLRIFKDLS